MKLAIMLSIIMLGSIAFSITWHPPVMCCGNATGSGNCTDIWVNETGDTMTGNLTIEKDLNVLDNVRIGASSGETKPMDGDDLFILDDLEVGDRSYFGGVTFFNNTVVIGVSPLAPFSHTLQFRTESGLAELRMLGDLLYMSGGDGFAILGDFQSLNNGNIIDFDNATFNGTVTAKHLNITRNATIGSSENRTQFISNGYMTMHGTARVRKNIEIAIGSLKPPATHPASWSDLGIGGAWEFSDGTTEAVVLEMPLPLDIDRTEDVVADIAWASSSTTGNCVWKFSYLMRSEDEAIDAAADDTLTETASPSSTSYGLTTTSFTIPAADISDTDKLLILKLERIGGDANDTLGDAAYLTAMNFNYISDKLGEPTG